MLFPLSRARFSPAVLPNIGTLTTRRTNETSFLHGCSIPQGGFVEHESAGEITKLLQGWREGDRKALDALVPIVYKELHIA